MLLQGGVLHVIPTGETPITQGEALGKERIPTEREGFCKERRGVFVNAPSCVFSF